MVNLEDGKIYEFIVNKYSELKSRDGGYYASSHDEEVFKIASNEFNMSIEELDNIYYKFQEISTKKQMEKLNKLPNILRNKKRIEMMGDILKNNKDLPFYKLEGEPINPIKSGLAIINEEYIELAKEVGENGWTIPMVMGLNKFEELSSLCVSCKEEEKQGIYNKFFSTYYNSNNFKLMVKHINKSEITKTRKALFNDCVDAYNSYKYLLCINSLATILEGLLSDLDDDKTNIKMMKICKGNMDATQRDKKLIINLVWTSFYSFISTLYKKSNFDEDEPLIINRHWLLHGRTDREYDKEDCLRLFNSIYTIVSIIKNK